MTTLDYEALVDDMRNELHGFGIYLARQRGSAIDLYGETDAGERMLVTWDAADGGTYTVRTPDVSATGVDTFPSGRGEFSPMRMVAYAIQHGYAVNCDDIERSDDVEEAAQNLDDYAALTLEILQIEEPD